MSYHRYSTRGIVLATFSQGESDIACKILTEDLGSVIATARSARTPRSKFMAGVQLFSFSRFSLIHGKYSWKIVGVQNISQTLREVGDSRGATLLWARYLAFIRRFVVGESVHPELFAISTNLHDAILRRSYSEDELLGLECIASFLVLHQLGHAVNATAYQKITDYAFSDEGILEVGKCKNELIGDINKALLESHL
jgi:recombinational DNA repair protein (RecF pathway)